MIFALADAGGDALDLAIALEAFEALLAAEAGLLVAAEGDFDATGKVLVDVDLTGIDVAGELVCPGEIAGEDTGDKAEAGAVGQLKRVFGIIAF
jgi:hypothetical protein